MADTDGTITKSELDGSSNEKTDEEDEFDRHRDEKVEITGNDNETNHI